MKLLQDLISIANELDQMGFSNAADTVDNVITKLAASNFNSTRDAFQDKMNDVNVYTYIESLGSDATNLDMNLQDVKNESSRGPSSALHVTIKSTLALLNSFINQQDRLKDQSADKAEEQELLDQNRQIRSLLYQLDRSF